MCGQRFRLEDLKYNPSPPDIKGGREFSKGPMEAFLKIEDILSHFADGRIDYEHAMRALQYAAYAIIPKMRYPEDVIRELVSCYEKATSLLKRLRRPESVKRWLMSHGVRKERTTILEFVSEASQDGERSQ